EIINYYPHARREPFRPATADDTNTIPAVKLHLSASGMPMKLNPDHWVAGSERGWLSPIQGLAAVEMLGSCPASVLEEFRNPPAAVGEKGQLVFFINGKLHRLNIAELDGKGPTVIDGVWKVDVKLAPVDHGDSQAMDPRLAGELISPMGKKLSFGVR